jgi:hypothetical protein
MAKMEANQGRMDSQLEILETCLDWISQLSAVMEGRNGTGKLKKKPDNPKVGNTHYPCCNQP